MARKKTTTSPNLNTDSIATEQLIEVAIQSAKTASNAPPSETLQPNADTNAVDTKGANNHLEDILIAANAGATDTARADKNVYLGSLIPKNAESFTLNRDSIWDSSQQATDITKKGIFGNRFKSWQDDLTGIDFKNVMIKPQAQKLSLVNDFKQLSIYAFNVDSGQPITGIPLIAIAFLSPEASGGATSFSYPLGNLVTDHAGYVSFDLTVFNSSEFRQRLQRYFSGVPAQSQLRINLTEIVVYPFGDNLLPIFAFKQGIQGPDFIYLKLDLDSQLLEARALSPQGVAMQNPNIIDWRLSPASFSISNAVILGEDGAETLLPSNLANQDHHFTRVAYLAETLGDDTQTFMGAQVLDFVTEWYPIGHSLGQILYSLPLAPGEQRNIAILDWRRTEQARRAEDNRAQEQLTHDQLRDRSVSEVIESSLQESQEGHSFSWGLGLNGGVAGSGASAGAAFGIGGGSSSSSGTRDFSANALQRIADRFRQASALMREARSTVVVQTTLDEKGKAETRSVANYNHSHTLTIQYYEVLQNYRVLTRIKNIRPALRFIRPRPLFTSHSAFLYRDILLSNLKDKKLASYFDLLEEAILSPALHQQTNAGVVLASQVTAVQADSGFVASPVVRTASEIRIEFLIRHLNAYNLYYHRAVWATESSHEINQWLSTLSINGIQLNQILEPVPAHVIGDEYTFAVLEGFESLIPEINWRIDELYLDKHETLVSLPSRGTLAEARLGKNNASEKIDNSRFWDWQTSPIPNSAPDIEAIDLGAPNKNPSNLTPQGLPAGILNIVNPPALPDPAGLSTVSSVLNTLGAFRDMSNAAQLNNLLTTLSNNAVQGQRIAAEQSRTETPPANKPSQAGNSGNSASTPSTPPANPQDNNSPWNNPPVQFGEPVTEQGPTPEPSPSLRTDGGRPLPPPNPTRQRPVRSSSHTRRIMFNFKYDTGLAMRGHYRVSITGGMPGQSFSLNSNTTTDIIQSGDRMGEYTMTSSQNGGTLLIFDVPRTINANFDNIRIMVSGNIFISSVVVPTTSDPLPYSSNTQRQLQASTRVDRQAFLATDYWDVSMPTQEQEIQLSRSRESGATHTRQWSVSGGTSISGAIISAQLNGSYGEEDETSESTTSGIQMPIKIRVVSPQAVATINASRN